MGRAITMENRQDELDRRLKLVEDAVEELSHELIQTTKVHHVDLVNETKGKTATNKDKKTNSKNPKVVESLL